MDETRFSISYSSAVTRGPCGVCGVQEKPEGNLALCLKDSGVVVCYTCGNQYAPRLQFCLDAYYTDLDARTNPAINERYLALLAEAARYGVNRATSRESTLLTRRLLGGSTRARSSTTPTTTGRGSTGSRPFATIPSGPGSGSTPSRTFLVLPGPMGNTPR